MDYLDIIFKNSHRFKNKCISLQLSSFRQLTLSNSFGLLSLAPKKQFNFPVLQTINGQDLTLPMCNKALTHSHGPKGCQYPHVDSALKNKLGTHPTTTIIKSSKFQPLRR